MVVKVNRTHIYIHTAAELCVTNKKKEEEKRLSSSSLSKPATHKNNTADYVNLGAKCVC